MLDGVHVFDFIAYIFRTAWMNQNIGTIFFQSVTLSLVIPAVLTLYNGVLEQLGDVKFLRKLLLTLRDRLKNRFAGIFVNVKMAFSVDISKEAFSSKVYLAAAVLDPNLKQVLCNYNEDQDEAACLSSDSE